MGAQPLKTKIKNLLNLNSLFNLVFIVLISVLLFSPPAKALLIRGLMKFGIFNPQLPAKSDDGVLSADVTFQDKSGKTISITSLRGKVIFINFWATWCPPCIAELPAINELYNTLKKEKNIEFIMVDTDHNFSKSLPFIAKHAYNLPVYNAYTNIPQNMLDKAIPATVVINKHGKIVFKHDGTANYMNKNFLAFLDKLLKEDL